jgi:hypothetical protein
VHRELQETLEFKDQPALKASKVRRGEPLVLKERQDQQVQGEVQERKVQLEPREFLEE